MQITSQMRLILKRMAMPGAQIEEVSDMHRNRYEMSWRENGVLFGCQVTPRMVKRLESMRLIKDVKEAQSRLALYAIVAESPYSLAQEAAAAVKEEDHAT